jgi:[acyl-carrier-protein] S-malonyltransferase
VCAAAAQTEVVAAANYNAPGQVVIAGHSAAVDRAIEGAKAAKAKRALKLAVSVPSHCALMRPAVAVLGAHLDALPLNPPRVPVVHNVDATPRNDKAAIVEALKAQLYQPVRWVQCVQALAATGTNILIECGPGKVLTGLDKRIVKDASHLCVHDSQSLDEALAALTTA